MIPVIPLSGNIVAYAGLQCGSAAATLWLARVASPESLATWFLWCNVTVLLISAGAFRYELGIVTEADDAEAARLLMGCVLVSCVSASVCVLATVFGCKLTGNPGGDTVRNAVLAALAGLFSSILQATASWHVRRSRYVLQSSLLAGQTMIVTLIQCLLAKSGFNDGYWLLVGAVFGYGFCAALGVFFALHYEGRVIVSSWQLRAIRDGLLRLRRFPMYSLPYTIVTLLRERMVYGFLAMAPDATVVAYFGLAHRVINLGSGIVNSSLRPVFFNLASRHGMERTKHLIPRLLEAVSVAIVPLWICGLFFSAEILEISFGEPWRDAVPYFALLSLPAFITTVSGWVDRVYDVTGNQRSLLWIESVFTGFTGLCLAVLFTISKNPIWLTAGLSIVFTLYGWYWLYATFNRINLERQAVASLLGQHLRLYATAAASAGVCVAFLPMPTAAIIPAVGCGLLLLIKVRKMLLGLAPHLPSPP